jgi:hypothetical protein
VADIVTRNPSSAIADLQDLIKEYPKVNQFYGALGQAYWRTGNEESRPYWNKRRPCSRETFPSPCVAETLMRNGDNKRAQSSRTISST